MNNKFSEDLYLNNQTGQQLYHRIAKKMPIIDYHCHLQPREIWENKRFSDLGEMWLAGDHYKWRAMRTFGIAEKYITGSASYYEKYLAFAKIMPQLIGNPLYIWSALELKRFFGIEEPLSAENADQIYFETKKIIQQQNLTPQRCMELSNVELVSTTEDPIDSLEYHQKLKQDHSCQIKVLSAFRPDQAMFCESSNFANYIMQLAKAAATDITDFKSLLLALEKRLKYFKKIGTTISDNGIPYFNWADYKSSEIDNIFRRAVVGDNLTKKEIDQYRSAFLIEMARMYNRNDYVMQLHIGTYLNANTAKVAQIGQSTGFDCTDDSTNIKSVGQLLDKLTSLGELPKTILYPLDSNQIENFAILAAAFCESGVRAKVQLGAPWWFNDQVYGIKRQLAAAANLYPISLSVGMLTDSRSFLSYPRHELYRRVLCNYLGELIERGEYFSSQADLKKVIENICYYNVKNFFDF